MDGGDSADQDLSSGIETGLSSEAADLHEPMSSIECGQATSAEHNLTQPGLQAGDDDNDNEPDKARMSDQEGDGEVQDDQQDQRWKPPCIEAVKAAHTRLKDILHLLRKTGNGYKDPKLDLLLRSWLEAMQHFLWAYINPESCFHNKWMAASLDMACALERGVWFAWHLREWSCTFIEEAENLPFNVYSTWNKSHLDDKDLKQEILTHLQSIGKYIAAISIVRYMARPDVQKRYKMKRGISEGTARNWLSWMGYCWTLEPSGQYVDGHEHEDVV